MTGNGEMRSDKLSDLFNMYMGKTPNRNNIEYWNNGINPWISIADMTSNGKYITQTKECITDRAIMATGIKAVPYNTVIMSFKLSVGKVSIVRTNGNIAYTNEAIMAFEIPEASAEQPILINDYVYYLLQSLDFSTLGNKAVKGKTLNKSILENTVVKYHAHIEQQSEIATRLDKVTDLIDKHNLQIQKLEALIKARFVEMFGDYRHNVKGFRTMQGSDLFKFSSGKFLEEDKRNAGNIPAYGGNGIVWHTTESLVEHETIIIGRVGAWCGNIHMACEPVWITDNAIYIKEFKTNDYELTFLTELMKIMDFHQYADFSGQPKITQKPLETLEYIVPPMELQNQFADFVEKVEKQKEQIQKSLEKVEMLKKALMQKYFG